MARSKKFYRTEEADAAGGDKKCLPMENCDTPPDSVPVGGGVLFVQGGYLKFKGPDGNVTVIAPS